LHYAQEENLNGILLSVDHMRAFDIIEWDFILKTLQYFKLGNKLTSWISIIYKLGHAKSAVQINGNISGFFLVSRGVRQGCPLSPLLYILVSELVTNYIRNRTYIRGIPFENNEHKISNYADDTNFFVIDFSSVREILEIYKRFQAASGATLKVEKTKILLFGALLENRVPDPYRRFLVDKI